MRNRKRFGWSAAVFLLAALLPSAAFGAGHAGGVTVFAGPNIQGPPPPGVNKQSDALFFFPKVVTVHVGDTVTWQFQGFHTATFPGPNRPYPFVVPLGGKQPLFKDGAGQSLWWGGAAPVLGVSPLSVLAQGGGTISSPSQVRSSGLMRIFASTPKAPPAPYLLAFTQPGTYQYECAVHSGMRGVVRVLPASASAPSAAAENQVGKSQLQRTLVDLKQLNGAKPASKLTVLVGVGHNATGAEIASFFPNKLVVKAGDTVTFRNGDETDIHTVTFGPAALRLRIEKDFVAPHGKQLLLSPLGVFSSEPPGSGTVQYDGTNHGHGYINSGILSPRGAPAKAGPQTYQVTFTKPGTYQYECVIHRHMDGTIVVH